jgi:diguanylate cyclase (GGDEF)-like protein
MINDGKLSAVLSEFARTVITDFPIQGILDHLVTRIVDVLPIDSAGVTLIAVGRAPHYIAASNADALQFEQLQTELREGPCLTSFASGVAVIAPDLTADDRFPAFAKAAGAAGLAAAFTFPLRHEDERLGALDLYRTTPGELDQRAMQAAQTLADVAAAYLLNARARLDATATSDKLLHLSMHDPLTGLPNRLLLQERIEQAARRAQRTGTNAAVLFADLDNFKHVNDTYGHDVGDRLLCVVAERLAGLIRPADTLARFAGDEFVILCEDLVSARDAQGLATRIHETMAIPFAVAGLRLAITASIGIAFAGPGESISNQLVVDADRAMYTAKRGGGQGRVIVDVRSDGRIRRHGLRDDLQAALDDDGLDVVYQPIVRIADGTATGVEALLRWNHPELGNIAPLTVVAIAEQTGLINELGAWVLDRACTDHRTWLEGNPSHPLDLAVNVSARQFGRRSFSQAVFDVVELTGMNTEYLILEMTESLLIDDSERVILGLAELHSAGIRLAIDDFGTGYSSLNYLTRLPFDTIKIDQSFIADTSSGRGRTVVAAIADLAHQLGMAVIAEGVETHDQHLEVAALGCEAAQGYFYARPMPASAIGSHMGVSLGKSALVAHPPAPALDGVAGTAGG